MDCGFGYESVAGIVWDVEPFVAVGGPGIGVFHAVEEVAMRGARTDPESESAVQVNPCTVLLGERDQSLVVVESTRVEISGLEDNNCSGGWAGS